MKTNSEISVFLDIEDGKLGVYVGSIPDGIDEAFVDLDLFLEESKVLLPRKMAKQYAEKLSKFCDELLEYANGEVGRFNE